MNEVIDFLKSQAILLVAISASITILRVFVHPLRAFFTRMRPSHVVITNPEVPAAVHAPAQPTITLTLAQFEDRLARREAEIRAELGQAQPTNHIGLKNELEELFRLKTDPESAFEERNQRLRDLGARLERESDGLETGALQAAQSALAAGDPTLADGLFADIADKAGGAVQAAARALSPAARSPKGRCAGPMPRATTPAPPNSTRRSKPT